MRVAAPRISTFHIAGPASREAALVVLRDEEGREGVGEAAPIAGWSGEAETLDAVMRALHGVCEGIDAVDEGAPAMAAIERALAPHRAVLEGCPTAVFALETALLDLIGQRRGDDVAACLRGAPVERDGIEVSALLVGAGEGEAFVERGLAVLARGFRVIKVKLRAGDDAALAREIEGLLALRRAAPAFELRLDPNGRWSVEEARRRLGMLAPLGAAFVEQPVPARELAELGACAVPWAADESLAAPEIVESLSREEGCAAFVLKPAALGVGRAAALARRAWEKGLSVTVTHFMDGAIGLAAACETALSLAGAGGALMACGLDPHGGLTGMPREMLPHHREAARVRPTGQVGLGLRAGSAVHRLTGSRDATNEGRRT